jgi:hypothetical protein
MTKFFEGFELPKLEKGGISIRSSYVSIAQDGTRTTIMLDKADRQRRVRSWPKKLGKHAGKDMMKSRANWNNNLDKFIEEKE